MRKIFPFLVFYLLCSVSCIDPNKDFKCLKLKDANGSAVGTSGNCDNDMDWENIDLTDKQEAFLDFAISGDVSGAESQAINGVVAYPIPAAINEVVYLQAILSEENKNSVLKIAIINTDDEALIQTSQLVTKDNSAIAIQMGDDKFGTGLHYRVIYQLQDEGGNVFYEGYGDLLLCDEYPVLDVADCY